MNLCLAVLPTLLRGMRKNIPLEREWSSRQSAAVQVAAEFTGEVAAAGEGLKSSQLVFPFMEDALLRELVLAEVASCSSPQQCPPPPATVEEVMAPRLVSFPHSESPPHDSIHASRCALWHATVRHCFSSACDEGKLALLQLAMSHGQSDIITSIAKSMVVLLCEVSLGRDLCQGATMIMEDLSTRILASPTAPLSDRMDAVALAALAKFVYSFWSSVEEDIGSTLAAAAASTRSLIREAGIFSAFVKDTVLHMCRVEGKRGPHVADSSPLVGRYSRLLLLDQLFEVDSSGSLQTFAAGNLLTSMHQSSVFIDHFSIPPLDASHYADCVAVPADISTALFPLRHCGATLKISPCAKANGAVLCSVGEQLCIVAPPVSLRLAETDNQRVDPKLLAASRPTTNFPLSFSTGVFRTAVSTPDQWASDHKGLDECDHSRGYTSSCAVKGIDRDMIIASMERCVGKAPGVQLFDLTLAQDINASQESLRAAPLYFSKGSDAEWCWSRLHATAVPSANDCTRRLRFTAPLTIPERFPHDRVTLTDPSMLSITSVASIDYGIVCVGPALRIVSIRDVLDPNGIGCPENPFLRFQQQASLSSRYGSTDTITLSAIKGYGRHSVAGSRGEECSVWDIASGSECCVCSLGSDTWVTSIDTSITDHVIAMGTSTGDVALWDTREGTAPYRTFRPNYSSCGSYSGTCAVQKVLFGATGARTLFVSSPSNAAVSQVKIFHIGFERSPVWESPEDTDIATFDVGLVRGGSYLHAMTVDGWVLGGDVSQLVQ